MILKCCPGQLLPKHLQVSRPNNSFFSQELSAPTALAKRNGEWIILQVSGLVVADLIQLKAGDVIPADATVSALPHCNGTHRDLPSSRATTKPQGAGSAKNASLSFTPNMKLVRLTSWKVSACSW